MRCCAQLLVLHSTVNSRNCVHFTVFINGFLAITISRGHKYRECYTSIDSEFRGASNGISCAALKRKFEKSSVFFISNNSFLAITISRGVKCRVPGTSVDREFQGASNDMSRVSLEHKFETSGVFFIFNNSFWDITVSRDDRDRSLYANR